MSGGASPRRRGDYFERKTKADLEARGWLVVRIAGSGSGSTDTPLDGTGADLLAISRSREPWLVSCKLSGKAPTAERRRLVLVAKRYGAEPVMASRMQRGVILYKPLRPDDDRSTDGQR